MPRFHCLALSCALLACGSIASAQVSLIGPFQGVAREGFESQSPFGFTPCIPGRIFDGLADLCADGGSVHITTGWNYTCSLAPAEGGYFAGTLSGSAEFLFDVPVSRFGGSFATNSGSPDATAEFFGADGALLSTLPVTIPADCSWTWNGWDRGGGPPIARVRLTSNAFGGAFLMFDAMEVDFCPDPLAYCTAKTNSQGCTPAIGAVGWPSASRASGFSVQSRPLLNNRIGYLAYGIDGPAALPFGGGTLCVAPTLRRTPPQDSSGNPRGVDCSGTFEIDMNLFAAGALGGNPLPELRQPGTRVFCQWISRDPGFAAPNNVSLSDALQYYVCP